MSGESGCCYPCIQCCCPDNSKDKFRHVQYKAPVDTNVTTTSEFDFSHVCTYTFMLHVMAAVTNVCGLIIRNPINPNL